MLCPFFADRLSTTNFLYSYIFHLDTIRIGQLCAGRPAHSITGLE